jgi:formiminotetrahydrofolate cyclodeaminase
MAALCERRPAKQAVSGRPIRTETLIPDPGRRDWPPLVMIHQSSFSDIVDSLAKKTPTPGGGAAAALAATMGASLFLMVVRYSQGKKANVGREAELATAEQALQRHVAELTPMAERDCRSFDEVSAAYALPKDTDAQKATRDAAIQRAMVGAMVVPEQTLGMVRAVFASIEPVVSCIGKLIVSDLAAGAVLLRAGGEGAFLNVRINAASLTDKALADATMARADAVLAEVRSAQESIAKTVDRLLA